MAMSADKSTSEPSKGGQPQQDEPSPDVGLIDPTKNVLDLVKAESKYQDGMREALQFYVEGMARAEVRFQDHARVAEVRFQDFARDAEHKFSALARESESRRVDQLADLRMIYETRIADMLRTSVESTSSLVSTQLVQIQNTFNERVSQLERFRYETGGKSSVADPALADALMNLGTGMKNMQNGFNDAIAKMAMSVSELKTSKDSISGKSTGRVELWGFIVGGIGLVSVLISIYLNVR